MLARTLSRLTYANVTATIALFLALGGGAYAALRVPRNSVGSRQIKANAVNSTKVANGSLLVGDFKAGQLPTGPQGLKGETGQQGQQGETGQQGIQGLTGARGPGTLTFDGQYPTDGYYRAIGPPIDGMQASISCTASGNLVEVNVNRVDYDHTFYGWGIAIRDGTLSAPQIGNDTNGAPQRIFSQGTSDVKLSAVATTTSSSTGQRSGYTHYDISGIRGNACNYHALIIPPG